MGEWGFLDKMEGMNRILVSHGAGALVFCGAGTHFFAVLILLQCADGDFR
jgi:hypothetical protein